MNKTQPRKKLKSLKMKRVTFVFNFFGNNNDNDEIREDVPLEIPPPKHPRIEEVGDDDDDDEEGDHWHTPSEDESWSDVHGEGSDDDEEEERDNDEPASDEDGRDALAQMHANGGVFRAQKLVHGVFRDYIYLNIREASTVTIKFLPGFSVNGSANGNDTFFVDGTNSSVEPTVANIAMGHRRGRNLVFIYTHRPASLFFCVADDLALCDVQENEKEKKLFYERRN